MAERVAANRLNRPRPLAAAGQAHEDHAGFGARVFAFALDSFVLLAFVMVFAAASFLNIFLRTDSGRENPTDPQIWASVVVLMLCVPVWLLFNLVLTWRRGQTVGQYVVGLAIAKEDGREAGIFRLLLYWLALHPLLFHPLLAGFWALLAYVALALTGSLPLIVASLTVAMLCIVAPLLSLALIAGDGERRGLHDRVAALRVVRLA